MKVAFDFDNTLTVGEGDGLLGFNLVMIRRAFRHAKRGDELWIVTARPVAERGRDRAESVKPGVNPLWWVHAFVRFWGLPIPDRRIVFVGGTGKGRVLEHHGIELLYDDRASQRASARRHGVRAEAPSYPVRHRGLPQMSAFPEHLVTPEDIAARWAEIFEEDDELDWSDDNDAQIAAERLSDETGLPVLGVGNTRAVFGLTPYRVLKLSFWHGEEDNIDEAITWEGASKAARRWLAPVIEADGVGYWLVMGRARPVSDRVAKQIRAGRFDAVGRKLGIDDLRSASNWGFYQSRLVVIDYGHLLGG